jgi:hypothetical protein
MAWSDSIARMRCAIALLCAVGFAGAGCVTPLIRNGALQARPYHAVLERTTAHYGTPLETPVPSEVIGRDGVPDLLRELLAEEWGEQAVADYQDALVSLGLWPADRDLVEEYVAVSREEVAGLYAPSRRTLYVVADQSVPFSLRLLSALSGRDVFWEMTLAHELVHALQHQSHPRLMTPSLWRAHDDASNAISAALEGHALRYGFEALDVPRLPSPEEVRDESGDPDRDEESALGRAPALLRLTLLFPYVQGYRLSYWEGHELLDQPPASSEQVLHPERRHEPFLAIDLQPLHARLPGGCRMLAENSLGELGLYVLFQDLAGDGVSPDAWQGWNGDRYLAARCPDGRAFAWVTAWDSEDDADEFEAAYRKIAARVQERAQLTSPPTVKRSGREVHVLAGGLAVLAAELADGPRRRPVATLEALLAHFDASPTATSASLHEHSRRVGILAPVSIQGGDQR